LTIDIIITLGVVAGVLLLLSTTRLDTDVVLVGAMIALGHADTALEQVIGFVGVLLAAMNAVGGYVVTERMLEMFEAKKKGRGT